MSLPDGADPDVWAALMPGPHRHSWVWTSYYSTHQSSEPPSSVRCACGLSYGEFVLMKEALA